VKLDGLDHHAGHELSGCQDLLRDVAGAEAELGLTSREALRLAERPIPLGPERRRREAARERYRRGLGAALAALGRERAVGARGPGLPVAGSSAPLPAGPPAR
jgi:hypothetical protein